MTYLHSVCYNANVPGAATPPVTAKILIVDDDEVVTQTFARMLRLEGYQVRTAITAENGLDVARESQPDAIILDLRMPILDGLDFLRRVRGRDVHVPVAIVTGDYFLSDPIKQELKSLGASIRFKPLWLEDLIALAKTLVA